MMQLVALDQTNQETTHRFWISFQSAVEALAQARIMRGPRTVAGTNHEVDRRQLRRDVRKDSRTWRFTRLRSTELPTAFVPTERPSARIAQRVGRGVDGKEVVEHAQTPWYRRRRNLRSEQALSGAKPSAGRFAPDMGAAGSRYGIRRLRPLARRRARTLRPSAVAMRARKPCVRTRLILLGW